MSWHGSLTCSYCYERGHTRRKCPEMKKRHDEYEALLQEGRENEASWGQRGAYREYKNQQEGLKESNKVCAFCGKKGHRVNTCPDRMAMVQKLKEVDEWFIPLAREVLDGLGIGVGTMLPYNGYVGGEWKDDVPVIVTGFSGVSTVGGLSVINLWEHDWFRPLVTNALTMQKHNVRLPSEFQLALYKRLFEVLEIKGWDWSQSSYEEPNRDIRYREDAVDVLGHPPREVAGDETTVISPMASSFESSGGFKFGFDYDKKREVNRLFRDSKTALIKERHQYRVGKLWAILKERGVI